MTARILSWEIKISSLPRSPSGPPVMTLVIFSIQPQLVQDIQDILMNGISGHPIKIVRDSTHFTGFPVEKDFQ